MIQLTSFLLGVGTALALPSVTRVIRPVVVEAAVAGMALFDETRRVLAEQIETLEDVAAEARARRAEMLMTSNGHAVTDTESADAAVGVDAPHRARRRAEGGTRRRSA